MTLLVCVKGNRHQAAQAMGAAGIPFALEHENTGRGYSETYGFVPDAFEDKIRELFHKDDAVRDALGRLPVGAVLLWNTKP